MRQKRTAQASIFDLYAEHEIGRELKAMSDWLDEHPEILDWITPELCCADIKETGREGLSVESILRCAILKQHRQLSYEALAFYLEDSHSFQAFARLPVGLRPKKSVLQKGVSAISDASWERINRLMVCDANVQNIERGRVVRVDSTVTETPVHAPTDSTLLWDAVRTQVRLMEQAQVLAGQTRLDWCSHWRVAKKRAYQIQYSRGKEKKVNWYRDLIKVTRKGLSYLDKAWCTLTQLTIDEAAFAAWEAQVKHYRGLIEGVIDQTQRRVMNGEQVPAAQKIFSLFEEHTDIIVKGSRDIQYGHKLNLTSGRSGLILDAVIEEGNPADSERIPPVRCVKALNKEVLAREGSWHGCEMNLSPLIPSLQCSVVCRPVKSEDGFAWVSIIVKLHIKLLVKDIEMMSIACHFARTERAGGSTP